MCGRFTLTWEEWRQVAGALGVENEGEAAASYRPRFNIAPTDEHFIITSEFERRKARGGRLDEPARAGPAVIETAAHAGTARSARDAARLATREQREK